MTQLELNHDSLRVLVHTFYDAVREDSELGPVFLRVLGDDWSDHLERLTRFWSTMMLGTREFRGNVYGTHMRLDGIEPVHFMRWLALFDATATRLFTPTAAGALLQAAHRVAGSLQLGYFDKVVVP